jgi:uncharacterized delta-60 repeat protein
LVLLFASTLFAQDGILDATFGNNGIFETGISATKTGHRGSTIYCQTTSSDNSVFLITPKYIRKFKEDGTIDITFGNNGAAELLNYDLDSTEYYYRDVLLDKDGKIIITAYTVKRNKVVVNHNRYKMSVIVFRLNNDGSIDDTFGENGIFKIQETDFPYYHDRVVKLAITDNNKIYLAFQGWKEFTDLFLYRINNNGSIDTEFGENGFWKATEFTSLNNKFRDMKLDSEGNIFLLNNERSGQYQPTDTLFVHKVNPKGITDISFGNNGAFSYSDSNYIGFSGRMDLSFQNDNKIIIGLVSIATNYTAFGPALIRLLPSGILDADFGNNGVRKFDLSDFGYNSLIDIRNIYHLHDKKIVLGGATSAGKTYLLKLNSDGSYDTKFGINGLGGNLSSTSNNRVMTGFFLTTNNKILVTGIQYSDTTFYFSRYNNDVQYNILHVSGNVSGSWDADTVYVDGDITVPLNDTLTISPVTAVRFTGAYKFLVQGTLIAEGTEKEKITFDASEGILWRGIVFDNTNNTGQTTSSIKFCDFTQVGGGSLGNPVYGTLYFNNSKADVTNIVIHNSYGIHFKKATGTITKSYFKNTSPFWMDSTNSFTISYSHFDSSEVSLYNSSPKIDSCIIERSVNGSAVVGIYGSNSSPEITNTVIRNNGGGVYFTNSNPVFEFVTIEDNHTNNYGGGGYFDKCNPTFKNVIIKNNTTAQYGGGLLFSSVSSDPAVYNATLDNCLIVKNRVTNTSNSGGGIVFWGHTKGDFTNCTIADNEAKDWAAVSVDSYSEANLKNCIVWNNGNNLDFQAGGFYNYSIIQGNYVGEDTAKTNYKNVDPLFRDAANGDYHLQSTTCGGSTNSPAIDAGDPNINDFLLDCATAGLGNNHSDLGAYGGANNWWDKSVLPDCHFAGDVNGTWNCDVIYVDGNITIPEGDTLKITENVSKVIITGPYQIIVKGVLLASGPENGTVGFSDEHILFQGTDWKGIFFNNLNDTNVGTSIIENCRFDYANKIDMPYQGGGAIAIYNSDNVIVRRSVFYLNQAKFGGAIYIENSDVMIEDCYFDLNGRERGQYGEASATSGGGMYVKDANPYLHKLKFISNQSIGGGAALLLDNASPVITNIMMVRNFTKGLGGAVQLINGASPKFVNMTTADNVAETAGGAIYLNPNSNPTIINSIMYGDTKPEIYLGGGTPVVTYSIIDSASSESYFGEGCLDVNPYLTNDVDYRLANNHCPYSSGNNAVSPAIDAGHPDSLDTELDCYAGLGTNRADMGYYGGRYSENTTDVEEENIETEIPNKYELSQNYPNPFNPSTTINYSIPVVNAHTSTANVTLKVYDILGREVAVLINKEQAPGNYSVKFDASNLTSGLYFYRLTAGKFTSVKKMMLLK